MNLQIQKSILENALSRSQSYLGKDVSNITSQICLTAKDGILTIQANNYDMGIISNIDNLFIVDEGTIIVSGEKFLSSVKAMKSGEIKIEVQKDSLVISQSRSRFKLPLFESLDFPSFPNVDNMGYLSINSVVMIDSFKKIMQSIDVNNPKFELTGALVHIGSNNVSFVSTDTRRLSIVSIDNDSENEIKLIVPRRAVAELQKLFFDEVDVLFNENTMVIKTSNTMFFTKLINGKFPDYKRIIPSAANFSLELDKMQFLDAIKQISTISSEARIIFKPEIIEIESITNDKNEARTAIEVKTNISEDLIIAVNSQYFIDFLNSININSFMISINEENMPFVLESDNLKTIIMPIVL